MLMNSIGLEAFCCEQWTQKLKAGKLRQYNVGLCSNISCSHWLFPVTYDGNHYVLVISLAKVLVHNGYRSEVRIKIHTDQGRIFESGVFKEFCRLVSTLSNNNNFKNNKIIAY